MNKWVVRVFLAAVTLVGMTCAYLYWRVTRFDALILEIAAAHHLDFYLVKSLVYEESWYDPGARGQDGEVGLMQVTAPVEREYMTGSAHAGKPRPKLISPADNLEVGCWYLRQSLDRFKSFRNPLPLALARYNAGESRVRNWIRAAQNGKDASAELDEREFLGAIDIPSTRDYVARVLKRYRSRGSILM